MPSKSKKEIPRNESGLIDALMSEMEDLRDGVSSPQEAYAFAQLADKAINAMALEDEKEQRRWIQAQQKAELTTEILRAVTPANNLLEGPKR